MKKLIVLSIALFSMVFATAAFGQRQKTQTICIKTSAECAVCKKKIETLLSSEKATGIKKSNVDLEKTVTVTYDSKKITKEKIRNVISDAGYDADTIPANNKALQQVKDIHK